MTPLEPSAYREIVARALDEDIGEGDVTTRATVAPNQRARGVLLSKCECVLAGLDVAAETFRQVDPDVRVTTKRADGDRLAPGDEIAIVEGWAGAMLVAERTALNLLQRMTGIATLARRFVEASRGRITVLDTRKTTPMLRELEKYAVRAGGAVNHRMRLDDGILIKDNHVRLAGGVAEAVRRARAARSVPIKPRAIRPLPTRPFPIEPFPIEVEVGTLDEVDEALDAAADILLLDNMSTDDIREAVRRAHGRAKVEISGGVTLSRLPELAATGADYVSAGALTHSAAAADISFEIVPA